MPARHIHQENGRQAFILLRLFSAIKSNNVSATCVKVNGDLEVRTFSETWKVNSDDTKFDLESRSDIVIPDSLMQWKSMDQEEWVFRCPLLLKIKLVMKQILKSVSNISITAFSIPSGSNPHSRCSSICSPCSIT